MACKGIQDIPVLEANIMKMSLYVQLFPNLLVNSIPKCYALGICQSNIELRKEFGEIKINKNRINGIVIV
jgi:hypothetical protein